VETTAPGKRPSKETFRVGQDPGHKTLKLGMLDDETKPTVPATPVAPVATSMPSAPPAQGEAPASSPPAPPPPAPQPPVVGDPTQQAGFPYRTVGYVVGGAGIVGVGVSLGFGLKAKGLDNDSKADGHCDATGCDDIGTRRRNDAIHAGNVATVVGVAGGVLLAGGAALVFVLAPKQGEPSAARVQLSPAVGPGSAGLVVSGSL
jgi:hypothetical protein